MRRLALQKSWRSPEEGDTLGCERAQENPPQQETAHGEVYRAGCPRVKLPLGVMMPSGKRVGSHVVATVSESRGPKDDRRDAFGLVEGLRLGAIRRRVYKERGGFGALGYHAKGYRWIRSDGVRVKNRLKALYRSRGVAVAGRGVYTATKRGEYLGRLPKSAQPLAGLLYEQEVRFALEEEAARLEEEAARLEEEAARLEDGWSWIAGRQTHSCLIR